MGDLTRRSFFKSSLAVAALVKAGGGLPARAAAKRSATDWVPLGKSGVQVTRLAFGTGTVSGRTQSELGQDAFTRMVRHAYDNGIRFFETAESYTTPAMLGEALKGLPRGSYRLMTKFTVRPNEDPQPKIDAARKTLNTEYIDILLMHCMRSPQWPEETKRAQDGLSEVKAKKIILAHGASVHGLQALAAFPGNQWLDVAMIRMNHKGVRMDTPSLRDTADLGDVPQVVEHTTKVHSQGIGVISMKLAGEGQFTDPEDREKSLKFAMGLGVVDSVPIGYKSIAEIDEAIERMNRVLNA
ncbi:MAG: aldo/keto reductase [Bryobacteraceae bacterium]|jgi:predicted aldo/keto reductase-like oxidoreductase